MEQAAAGPVDQKYPIIGSDLIKPSETAHPKPRQRARRKINEDDDDAAKRRCVSTACIACRYATFSEPPTHPETLCLKQNTYLERHIG